MTSRAPTAAVALIGDELLTGKIRDENGVFLIERLRSRGVRLMELAMIPDDFDAIGSTILRLAREADIVFTSGGVGPTHDDITLAAIAQATKRPLVRDEALAAHLRRHYGDKISEDALRMADLPQGTTLCADEGWPVFRLNLDEHAARIYILPGVPNLLRLKIEQLERLDGELPRGSGWYATSVVLTYDESHLARYLQTVVSGFPEVSIGSYPRWDRSAQGELVYTVRITFDVATELAARAEAAKAALLRSLESDSGSLST